MIGGLRRINLSIVIIIKTSLHLNRQTVETVDFSTGIVASSITLASGSGIREIAQKSNYSFLLFLSSGTSGILQLFRIPAPKFRYVAYPSQAAYGAKSQKLTLSDPHNSLMSVATVPPRRTISPAARIGFLAAKKSGIQRWLRNN